MGVGKTGNSENFSNSKNSVKGPLKKKKKKKKLGILVVV